MNSNLTHIVATFVTSLRASSLVEVLTEAGIASEYVQPKWTNKRLPPPRVEVRVHPSTAAHAAEVIASANFKIR